MVINFNYEQYGSDSIGNSTWSGDGIVPLTMVIIY